MIEKNKKEYQTNKDSHDLVISPFAPSLCRKCGKSGMELGEQKCHAQESGAEKEHNCKDFSASWEKGGWLCHGCRRINKCEIRGNQQCCPDWPHKESGTDKKNPKEKEEFDAIFNKIFNELRQKLTAEGFDKLKWNKNFAPFCCVKCMTDYFIKNEME